MRKAAGSYNQKSLLPLSLTEQHIPKDGKRRILESYPYLLRARCFKQQIFLIQSMSNRVKWKVSLSMAGG